MTDNIVRLQVHEAGDHYRIEAEKVLKGALEHGFERMVILGRTEDGVLYVAGTANAGESLVLIEQAKHFIVFGKDAAE
jgi:hypothetical protein